LRRLIIRPGGIGDTILSFPAMQHLQPDEVWVRSEMVPLVRFAEARSIAATGLDLLGIADVAPPRELIRRLAAFGEVVSWYGTNRPAFREVVAHFGLPFRFLPALPADETIGAADFFARQVGAPQPAVPRIDFDHVRRHGAAVLHPFSGSLRKNWPLDRFEQLAGRLSRDMTVEWAARPDWVRFENLDELGIWLAGARLYVGNDSGVTHLAAAAGVPTVALFGPTDPRMWAPRGERVRVVQAPTMDAIELETTLLAIRELLAE
jgi:heptosyltransferase III